MQRCGVPAKENGTCFFKWKSNLDRGKCERVSLIACYVGAIIMAERIQARFEEEANLRGL